MFFLEFYEGFFIGVSQLGGITPVFQIGCVLNIAISVWKSKLIKTIDETKKIDYWLEDRLQREEIDVAEAKNKGLLKGVEFIGLLFKILIMFAGIIGRYIAVGMVIFSGYLLLYSGLNPTKEVSNSQLITVSLVITIGPFLAYYTFLGLSSFLNWLYSKICVSKARSVKGWLDVLKTNHMLVPKPPEDLDV